MLKEIRRPGYSWSKEVFFSWILVAIIFVLDQKTITAQEMHALNSSPTYQGGNRALKEFINDNLVYPDAARKEGLAGSVDVRFTINKEGKVEDIKVMKGISNECDAEALRLIYLMTGWIPGKRQGKPVNTIVYMPIEFKGDKKSNPLIIKGKVVEKNTGLPVEGALIIVKGTNIGSVTGIDGSYKLELPPQSNFLECQGMGYSPEEVSIDYHSTINIELETEYTVIDLSYN